MAAEAVERAGQALLDTPLESANNVRPLLAKLAHSGDHDENTLLTTIAALKMFFTDAFATGQLPVAKGKANASAASSEDAAEVHSAWLSRQHAAFQSRLLQLLVSHDPTLQVAALAAVMEAVRSERPGSFGHVLFRSALAVVLQIRRQKAGGTSGGRSSLSGELLGVLSGKYLQFADVRYHTLLALQALAAQQASNSDISSAEAVRPLFEVLMRIPVTLPREDFEEGLRSWSGAAESGAAHAAAGSQRKKRKAGDKSSGGGSIMAVGEAVRWMTWDHQHRAYGDTWLAVLKLRLPADLYRKVLIRMPDLVIPAAPNPLLLADFLSASVDQGGLTGLLALNGLFVLVTRHGLEYPAFYARLYGLLTLDAFQASQRVRFFQLVDVFLASPLVPAYTAAAFIKRFARLSLRAPPAGAAVCLGFIHNLLRRHPATNQLRHRPPPKPITLLDGSDEEEDPATSLPHSPSSAADVAPAGTERLIARVAAAERGGEDVYDESEPDLEQCRALESSLWEVAALRCHYDPEVASFTAILDKDLSDKKRTAEVDMQPLLGRSYGSRFATEASRRLKAVPTAHYTTPPRALFPAAALGSTLPGWSLS